MIREISEKDYNGLMTLYMQLHDNPMPEETADLQALWKRILHDKDHHIIVAEEDGKIVSSCVCVIIPNLTHNRQPYAFGENVITDKEYRKQGLATACLDYAREIAVRENCYKLMLLTGVFAKVGGKCRIKEKIYVRINGNDEYWEGNGKEIKGSWD